MILSLISKWEISLSNFLRLIGYGSRSAGHRQDLRSSSWGIRALLIAAWEISFPKWPYRFKWRYHFRGVEPHLRYYSYGILTKYRNFLLTLKKSWRTLDPSALSRVHVLPSLLKTMKPLSDIEIRGIRLYTNRWLDEFFRFNFELDPKTSNKRRKEKPFLRVVNQSDYLKVSSLLEGLFLEIFQDTPLYDRIIYGRREGFINKSKEWLELIYPKTSLHYGTEELLQYICDDPSSWLTRESTSDILFIEGLLATEPSTGITEKVVQEMKDLSFILSLKSLCYHDYFLKHDTKRISEQFIPKLPPGFRI
jgi:hypothetical protein